MKRFLKIKLFCVLVLPVIILLPLFTNAQEPHFSQFFDAPLLRNPSLAGLFEGDIRVQAVLRNQWASIATPYKTVSLNAEFKKPVGKNEDFITSGMQILYDRAGVTNFTVTHVLPAVNYHKSLSADDRIRYLSLGFMGGYVQRRIDRSKITTNSQFDGFGFNPSLADGETFTNFAYHYWDASVGISYNSALDNTNSQLYFIGIAYHHFNRPVNSFYKDPSIELNPKWVVSGGIKLNAGDNSWWTLQGDYSKQGNYTETIAGALYSIRFGDNPGEKGGYAFHAGAFFRWNDAMIPVIKMDYNLISVGLSYDANISQLKAVSQGKGGFELSLTYKGFTNSGAEEVKCPRF
ncbi:MAG: type secretion system rane protein PorP/SprF [Chitinophagaceae bacterium]|nr:type secretion system rane protein PorP/SprF [Chitinophagaceae bacterium]